MIKLSKEPRLRSQIKYSRELEKSAKIDLEKRAEYDMIRAFAKKLEDHFGDSIKTVKDKRFVEKNLELWVFTPETLLDFVIACGDITDDTYERITDQLNRIVKERMEPKQYLHPNDCDHSGAYSFHENAPSYCPTCESYVDGGQVVAEGPANH